MLHNKPVINCSAARLAKRARTIYGYRVLDGSSSNYCSRGHFEKLVPYTGQKRRPLTVPRTLEKDMTMQAHGILCCGGPGSQTEEDGCAARPGLKVIP